ncbi:unnamed protein product [Penicillium nalgiovense]|nr:unnamed protein product [Penicillium nalgiovense]
MLRQLSEPSIQPKDYYIYGRSVDNQRIKAWWGMLLRASTRLFYITFFPPPTICRLLHEG